MRVKLDAMLSLHRRIRKWSDVVRDTLPMNKCAASRDWRPRLAFVPQVFALAPTVPSLFLTRTPLRQ